VARGFVAGNSFRATFISEKFAREQGASVSHLLTRHVTAEIRRGVKISGTAKGSNRPRELEDEARKRGALMSSISSSVTPATCRSLGTDGSVALVWSRERCRHSLEKRAVTNTVKGIIGKRPSRGALSRDIWPRLELILARDARGSASLRAREIRENAEGTPVDPPARRSFRIDGRAIQFSASERRRPAAGTRADSENPRALAPPFGRFVPLADPVIRPSALPFQ